MRRPPRSTHTDTRLPVTTLFRSVNAVAIQLSPSVKCPSPNHQPSDNARRRVPAPSTSAISPVSASKANGQRSEEHTSELQSLMRISYAVFCLKKTITHHYHKIQTHQSHQ